MPEPMRKLTVVTLRDFDEKILGILGALGVLHLKKVEGLEFFGLKSEELKVRQEYTNLYDRVNLLRKRLGATEIPETGDLPEVSKTELNAYVQDYERKLDDLLLKLSDEKERLSELNDRRRTLKVLEENNVSVDDLGKFQDKFVKAGLISRELSSKLDKYFFHSESLKCNIVNVSPSESFVIISGRNDVEEQVTTVLSSFNFREFTFPQSIPKETHKAIRKIEEDIERVKQKIKSSDTRREEVKLEVAGKLITIEHNIMKKMLQGFDIDVERLRESLGFNYEEAEEKKAYGDLYERFNRLRERLGAMEIPANERAAEMSEKELKSSIESSESVLDRLLSELDDAKKTLNQLEERKRKLELLRNNSVEVGDLGRTHDKFMRAGLIRNEVTHRLDKYFSSLKYLPYKITPISPVDNFIVLMGISDIEEWVLNILSLFNFREFTFPQGTPKENDEALKEVDGELGKLNSKIDMLYKEKNKLKHEFMEKLSTFGQRLRDHIHLSEASSLILRSENVSVFQGWIPKSEVYSVKRVIENLNSEIKNKVAFTIDEPSSDEEPPTLISTTRAIRPFSIITRMLGTPNYREINPTGVLPILWVVMFGFMFPDLGQGIFIIVLGAILGFKVKKDFFGLNLIKIGKLLICLCFSAAFFGALFGEFFLLENVIPALWLRPLESSNVWFLLKVAIFFGIAQIYLGLTFGLINSIKKKDYIGALLGEHSVASLTLFSGILILIIGFWTTRSLSILVDWTILIPIVGLTAILMKSTVKKMIGEQNEGGILEDFGTAIHILISLLSNTVSYARLAGFLLAHVALAAVIDVLMMKSVTLGLTGLVFMNFLALTIELLVVMIQALRLLYYEFSTKFYSGTGVTYNPLTLKGGKFKSVGDPDKNR